MMKNYDQSVKIYHNPNWPDILDHPYRILILGGSGSRKTNVLLNLVKHQRPDVDKIQDIDKTYMSKSIRIKVSIAY